MLGGALLKVFNKEALGWDREEADATDFKNLKLKIENLKIKPTAVINCIAYNDVDGAEENQQTAFLLNEEVPKNLALICNELNIPFVHISTNYVFDGEKGEYVEADEPKPLSMYGKSKRAGELIVIGSCQKYYIVRTAVLFGEKGLSEKSKKSFVDIMLNLAKEKTQVKAVKDEINSITYIQDLAQGIKNLLDNKFPYGIYHITNSGSASWYEFAREIFDIKNIKIELLPVLASEFFRKAGRPKKAVLINTKLPPMRAWQEALKEFLISNFYITIFTKN